MNEIHLVDGDDVVLAKMARSLFLGRLGVAEVRRSVVDRLLVIGHERGTSVKRKGHLYA